MYDCDERIHINDIFWTFQGEGRNAGRRALFVRMPKCNLSCSWCDTEFDSFKEMTVAEFCEVASQETARFAVITGGEPLMNPETPLVVKILKTMGFYVATETNGTMPYRDGIDWVTCSPKRDAAYKVHRELRTRVDEYKVVVDRDFDWDVLEKIEAIRYPRTALYLSPEFNDLLENTRRIESYIRKNPLWSLSLQTHKWVGFK